MQDSVGMEVIRGSETWQFFAFVFAAVFALAITLLDSADWFTGSPSWAKVGIKIIVFAVCFYFLMVNNWTRNRLVDFLTWLKVEHH